MQVFKAALRIFFKHPIYITIYLVGLGFMAIFIGMGNAEALQDEFTVERPDIAIINRDGSDLSKGLSAFLEQHGTLIEIDDSRLSMQDATAQNQAAYIMIIPEGFGDAFVASAAKRAPAPALEAVHINPISATMLNGLIDEYLSTAYLYAASGTATSQAEIVKLTSSNMDNSATVTMVRTGASGPVSQQWIIYMLFSAYTCMLSVVVCVGLVLAAFNRTDIRRRDVSSPISSLSMNAQIAAACVVITLLVWVWLCVLGLAIFGWSLAGVGLTIIGLSLLALLVFSLFALAFGFFLGQLTSSEIVLNAAGNITGLVLSFLGGIWLTLDFMGETLTKIAHFTPTFYYSDALAKVTTLQDFSFASVSPVLVNMGIILLFAIALIAIALAAGRLKMQSAEAGGNAGAARVRR